MMALIYRHSPNANSNPWNTSHMAFVRLARSHAFDKPLTISRPEVSHTHTYTHQTNQCRNELVKKNTFFATNTYTTTHTNTHIHILLIHVLNCSVKIQIP